MPQDNALVILKTNYTTLIRRAIALQTLEAYYIGDHPLPFLTSAHAAKLKTAFRRMLEESRTNFMRLLIDVVDERLQVEGIRLSAQSEPTTDKESWDVWQANQMDSLSRAGILDSLIKGVSYISVWPSDGKYPTISVEDAAEVLVVYEPGSNFRKRQAAIKVWQDGDTERANVYLPDEVWKFERRREKQEYIGRYTDTTTSPPFMEYSTSEQAIWTPLNDEAIPNTLGVVPFVPLRNRPRLLIEGESEIVDQIQVQNQINGLNFLLALAGYFGAHKQRWVTGITLTEDEATGEVKEPFDVAIDRMLVSEDGETKFGEFSQTDLDGYLKAIEQKVGHLAITTRTPKHYLLPQGQDPSGDSIRSSESGLIRRTERKQDSLGEAFEEVMNLAKLAQGSEDIPVDSEIVWADPATESEAVQTDATIKKYEAGLIPAEQALEDLGYTQTQITRIMANRAADQIVAALSAGDTPAQTVSPAKTTTAASGA